MASKKNKNVVKFSKRLDINVGLVILAVVCIYIVVSILLYASSKKTIIYEVNAGSLSLQNVYTAVIERDESVYYSEFSGTYNTYMHSSDRVNYAGVVYSVDEAGRVSDQIHNMSIQELTEEDLQDVAQLMTDYTITSDADAFSNIYDLHNAMDKAISQLHSTIVLDDIESIIKSTSSESLFHLQKAAQTGLVMYSYDTMTNFSAEQLSKEIFDNSNYKNQELTDGELINTGDIAYRLIHSDDWTLYILLNEDSAAKMMNDSVIELRFLEKDITCKADFTIIHQGDQYYGKITLHKFMINFADERYVQVEISQTKNSGLKIPKSAVLSKSFYTVPKQCLKDGDVFTRIYYNEKGDQMAEAISPTIYDEDDQYYYIGMNDLKSGDQILFEGDDTFVVGTIGERYGVYCVNRGYAIFKIVEIIDQNDEYIIAKRGNSYGLAVYDHIVLDYETVNENEIVN